MWKRHLSPLKWCRGVHHVSEFFKDVFWVENWSPLSEGQKRQLGKPMSGFRPLCAPHGPQRTDSVDPVLTSCCVSLNLHKLTEIHLTPEPQLQVPEALGTLPPTLDICLSCLQPLAPPGVTFPRHTLSSTPRKMPTDSDGLHPRKWHISAGDSEALKLLKIPKWEIWGSCPVLHSSLHLTDCSLKTLPTGWPWPAGSVD